MKRLLNDLDSYRVASQLTADRITFALSRMNGASRFDAGGRAGSSLSAYGLVHEMGPADPPFAAELELSERADGGGIGKVHIERFGSEAAQQYLSVVAKLADPEGKIAEAIYTAFQLANTKGGRFVHVTVHKPPQDPDHERAILPRLTYTSPVAATLVVVHQQAILQSTPRWGWSRPWRGYPIY